MVFAAVQCACLLCVAVAGADPPNVTPRLKVAADPVLVARKQRHFVVQVTLVEVDEQGRETLVGEPKIQTAGGNAGLSIDHPDGRRFEFIVRLTDRFGNAGPGDDLMPARTSPSPQAEGILKKLEETVDLNFAQLPRREVLRELSKRTGVGMAIDPDSVRAVADEMEVPIDLTVKNERVSTVLTRLIEPLKLGYTIKHDVVFIASAEKLLPSPEEFVFKTYDVADLVNTVRDLERESPDFAALIDRIKTTVLPNSWSRKEATATIVPFKATLSIGVRQTALGHAAIGRLLEQMRQEAPMKIPE